MFKHKWNFWLIKEIFIFGWKKAMKSKRSELQQGSGCWALRIHLLPPSTVPTASAPTQKNSGGQDLVTALEQVLYLALSLVCSGNHQYFVHGYFWGGKAAGGSMISTLLEWLTCAQTVPHKWGLEVWPWCVASCLQLGTGSLKAQFWIWTWKKTPHSPFAGAPGHFLWGHCSQWVW